MAQTRPSPNSAADARNAPLPPGTRIAAVVSTYHEELGAMMAASARHELEASGLSPDNYLELRAPGAFEMPLIARRLAVRDDIDAVLCFGLVLKGETSHDEHIATAVASGIMSAALQTDTPVLFGVLTCNTLEQAKARALSAEQGGAFDKGREVARAAVMAIDSLRMAGEIGINVNPAGFSSRPVASRVSR